MNWFRRNSGSDPRKMANSRNRCDRIRAKAQRLEHRFTERRERRAQVLERRRNAFKHAGLAFRLWWLSLLGVLSTWIAPIRGKAQSRRRPAGGTSFNRAVRNVAAHLGAVEFLEERTLLSGISYDATTDQPVIGTSTITAQLNQSQNVAGGSVAGHVISFVDAGLTDYQSIVRAISGEDDATSPGSGFNEVVLLDPTRDGIQQITQTLSGRSEISAIRIFSHGTSGALLLGSGKVDAAGLQSHADQFASWSRSLPADADILLYGCNVADGQIGLEYPATVRGEAKPP